MYYTIQDALDDIHNVADATPFHIVNSYGEKLFPVSAHSYRGVYEEVAFATESRTGTVGEFRAFLTSVIGQTYWSRGGTQHTMEANTFLHIAEPGMLGESPDSIELVFSGNSPESGYYIMRTEED